MGHIEKDFIKFYYLYLVPRYAYYFYQKISRKLGSIRLNNFSYLLLYLSRNNFLAWVFSKKSVSQPWNLIHV